MWCGFGQSLGRPIGHFSFIWSAQKNWLISETGQFFLSAFLGFFVQSRYSRVTNFQKRREKKFKSVDKRNCLISETGQFSFVWPKKSEIDCAIGRPKRLTKTTWKPLYFVTNHPKYCDWFCQIYENLYKFKPGATCVMNFVAICVNLCKSDKITIMG